ncbi:type I glyceraldehyde-3-phosphate dehydrogenase [Patescibacteria group bacterium]|nr:MAG: type I glyceraldehyde-3-phosphate dehydrogenase [Patescibacteria group bacterium]
MPVGKKIRVAINGFGRIGRTTFKAALERPDLMKKLEFVAVNDLMDAPTLAHMLKYDTVFRTTAHEISAAGNTLVVDGMRIAVTAEKDPALLPWKKMGVDVVLECTGRFTKKELAELHVTKAGAKRVIVSAPAKGGVPTFLIGVNADGKKEGKEAVINNASCTTNCVGPVTAVIESVFGVKKAAMTTIHAVTAEQNLVDGPPPALHRDLRRARSALMNLVPTTTGAAVATTEAIPELRGLFDGFAIRAPIIDVSLSDFTFLLKKKTTVKEVNDIFRKAANSPRLKGVLGVSEAPLVSTDYIGSTYSAVVDLEFTKVIDGDLLKVLAWYDNEWGYSMRLVEMAVRVGETLR